MGKTKEERERIIAIIEENAKECETGKPVFHFDVRDSNVGAAELKRHAKRLRALIRIIKGKVDRGRVVEEVEEEEMSTTADDIYQRALNRWGAQAQLAMLQEECGELIAAVSQYNRNRVDEDALAEEIADVLIMCGQIRTLVGYQLVSNHMEKKLDRLRGRLKRASFATGEYKQGHKEAEGSGP